MSANATTAAPTGHKKHIGHLSSAIGNPAHPPAALADKSTNTPAPKGRKKIAQGNALGNPRKNTSSPEGAIEAGLVALGELSEGRVSQDGPPSRGEFTYVDISSIDRETKRIVDPKVLPVAKAPSRAKQVLKAGDVVVSMTRPNLNAVALVPPDLDGAIGSTGFHVLRAKDAEPGFLFYAVQAPDFIDAMCQKVQGALYPAVRPKDISYFCLPPFSLAVQRRIVAEIEKQFTRLEAGVTALRRVQANLKRYRAAVLKAACEGRLVPTEAELAKKERRKYEPASELIARTQTPPRPNRWNSRSKDVIPGHPALAVGNPQTKLPEGWVWSALVEIAKMESGHTPSRNHREWWDGDVAWIGITDAREHDGRTIHETLQHTNLEGIANSASRLLPAGTVCISRTASVGYVVVMGREMATSQDFVNWIPTPAVTSDWLRVIFSADREALRRFGKGSVHKTIYFPEWLSVHIAVPPLAEQTRIVAEVERRLSVVEELKSVVSANLQRATRLRQSILQKAFSGDL
jgi:type I restriction enzyme, S subunit